jgi:uncharacterized membrane protein YjjP (DUF1212 family)
MRAELKELGNFLSELATNPYAYVIVLSFMGAASVVAGVAVMAGLGLALVTSGVFMLAAASYITKGMRSHG